MQLDDDEMLLQILNMQGSVHFTTSAHISSWYQFEKLKKYSLAGPPNDTYRDTQLVKPLRKVGLSCSPLPLHLSANKSSVRGYRKHTQTSQSFRRTLGGIYTCSCVPIARSCVMHYGDHSSCSYGISFVQSTKFRIVCKKLKLPQCLPLTKLTE